jgi:hypothetical protein
MRINASEQSEVHLFIIWGPALSQAEEIYKNLACRFEILDYLEIK